jgi:tRNA nucleotidyltransferase (CCA-adding enzyme)
MKTYLVGGAVRDKLLGVPIGDLDYVVVGATERQMLDQGFRRLDAAFPVFLHPESGDEYALARRERKTGPGYKGFAVDAGPDVTLEQDLARRDLTINALALDESGNLIDPFGGKMDLEQGLLRHITPAFSEDPVRLLRAARFAAKLGRWGFRPAHETHALLKRMAGLDELTTVLPERLREEMIKAMGTEQPWRFLEVLHACGALQQLLPPLAHAMGETAGHDRKTIKPPIQVLQCVSALVSDPGERLAALLASLPEAADAKRLCSDLRLDRATTELLDRILECPAGRLSSAEPHALLATLERIKALHHPQRIQQLGNLWKCLGDPENRAAERLNLARRAVSTVSADQLLAQGWSGPELGTELRRLRLRSIEEALGHG